MVFNFTPAAPRLFLVRPRSHIEMKVIFDYKSLLSIVILIIFGENNNHRLLQKGWMFNYSP